ncbi:MAG: carbamoyltransferase HypF [Chloroflexi bacterium]|nr:carbamoyltransferase HypF [Chloroflexota bacterium]
MTQRVQRGRDRAVAEPDAAGREARVLEVGGVVQGVGFRPFVWRLATELGIAGRVRNAAGRVEVEALGTPAALDALGRRLRSDAPPRARVERVAARQLEAAGAAALAAELAALGPGFRIDESVAAASTERLFPPDIATCDDCLAELADPADRRHRYPFVNCTNCGPRATIIDELPYDRARTTMRVFPLCPACDSEYRDPANRRFHAEPVACPACGPRLSYQPAGGAAPTATGEDALAAALADLAGGRIVAIKGLGGYHLACDATDEAVVARLRDRKRRWAKPFAVMVADLDAARAIARVTAAEESLLTSPARPIVLLARRTASGRDAAGVLAPGVTAGNRRVGVFLPYTPLHHLLMAGVGRPIVLTSGNLADEPLATDDGDALARLAGLADSFLAHDREIRARYDDSVTRVVAGRESVIRRGRGYAPDPLPLPVAAPEPVLAVGAELKHTFTLASGARAHVAPHNGDLEDLSTHRAFTDGLAHLSRLLALEPAVVAHDLHPVAGPFLGVAYDGLGMGDDGTFWGGEVLLADLQGYRRLARFGLAPMPGGALAIARPYRMALGYLFGAERVGEPPGEAASDRSTATRGRPSGGEGASTAHPFVDPALVERFVGRLDPREVDVVRVQVGRGLNAPVASSAGRLFDAAASLLGLRDVAEHEAQAAIDLEMAAGDRRAAPLPYQIRRVDGLLVLDPRPILGALLEGLDAAVPVGRLAAAFHESIVEATCELLAEARAATGLRTVALSGGVFQNRRLAAGLLRRLAADGFEPVTNEQVPANDGGISYGQAVIAAARLAAGTTGAAGLPARTTGAPSRR